MKARPSYISRVIIRRAFYAARYQTSQKTAILPFPAGDRLVLVSVRVRSLGLGIRARKSPPREKSPTPSPTEKTRSARLLRFSTLSNRRSISSFSTFHHSFSDSHLLPPSPIIVSFFQFGDIFFSTIGRWTLTRLEGV